MAGSVIGAVASSVIGGAMSSSASKKAAGQQAASADAAIEEQRRQFDLTRQDLMPFYNTGVAANQQLAYLMGLKQPGQTPVAGTPAPGTATTAPTATPTAQTQQSAPAPLSYPDWITQNHYTEGQTGRGQPGSRDAWNRYVSTFPSWENYAASGIEAGEFAPLTAGVNAGGYYGGAPAASTTAQTPVADPYANINPDVGGYGSLAKSFSMSDFEADPGYAFRMSEGQKALERSAAAKGGLLSGAAMKAATRFGQDSASQEYMNAYNRYNTNQTNLYNRLAGLAGSGQTSANTLASAGQNAANNISEIGLQKGNVQAAGTVGSANAWSTGLNQLGNVFGGQTALPWQARGNVNPAGGYY